MKHQMKSKIYSKHLGIFLYPWRKIHEFNTFNSRRKVPYIILNFTFVLKYQQSISEKWGFLMDNPVARLPYKELEPWHYYCDNIVALLKAWFHLNSNQTL